MSGLEVKACSVCEGFGESQYEVFFGAEVPRWVCSRECARIARLTTAAESLVMLFTIYLVVFVLIGAALIIVTGNNS